MNAIETQDYPEIILPSGNELSKQQQHAAWLSVATDMTHKEIALETGYASQSTVCTFLNSNRGREAVREALTQHLTHAATTGLKTMIALASSAKSETVRQAAAADLLNRARVGLDAAPTGTGNTGKGLSININLGDGQAGLIDVTPD